MSVNRALREVVYTSERLREIRDRIRMITGRCMEEYYTKIFILNNPHDQKSDADQYDEYTHDNNLRDHMFAESDALLDIAVMMSGISCEIDDDITTVWVGGGRHAPK